MPRVTAVIVSHDGARWLPHLLAGLDAATCTPDRIVAVDSGSVDTSKALLTAGLGVSQLVEAPPGSGFGAAVQRGLDALDSVVVDQPSSSGTEWIWLLHDDCSPAPSALAALLDVVAADPEVSVVGCRVRAWPRGRRLLEIGTTITGTGHRETGLEPGEYDQGQHDTVRQVLAVSSAGMLVRREIWDRLGGFDRRLPLFRDDVDFGWRVTRAGGRVVVSPEAVLFHAEAATRGVRTIASTSWSSHRADRRAAIYVLLVNCSLLVLPLQYVRLSLGSLLRALGYLFGKLPAAAFDEVVAAANVLLRPTAIATGRAERRSTSTAPHASVRALLPAWWTPYLNGLESVLSRFSRQSRDPGPSAVDEVAPSRVGWTCRHPLVCLTGILTLAGLVASRGLWGGGSLQGGSLLPAPGGAGDWWRLYAESWHSVAFGSTEATSPYVAALGLVGGALLGKSWLTVDLIMLLAVPLAGVGAFIAARRLVDSLVVGVWMAACYALLPVLTGAVTSGHLGSVVATILLPWLVRFSVPLASAISRRSWRVAVAPALLLAAMAAFCPLAWVMAALLAVAASPWMLLRRTPVTLGYAVVAVLLPVALLAPWSLRLFGSPELLLLEAGSVDASTPLVSGDAWQLALGRLGAAGDAPWWLTAGVFVAALLALLRSDRRNSVATCWLVIAVGLGVAAVVSRQLLPVQNGDVMAYAWLGFPVIVVQGAAIAAAGFAADGVARYMRTGSFGWRQPVAALAASLAVLAPLAGLVWWVGVAPHGSLDRVDDTALPAYVLDDQLADSQQRVLLLTGNEREIDYQVLMDDGVRLGDDSVAPRFESEALEDITADVLAEGQPNGAARLADLGIGYVMLLSPADPDLVSVLDGVLGLVRASTDVSQVVGWQVGLPTGLVRLLDPDAPSGEPRAAVLGSVSGVAETSIPEASDSRTLTVAVPADTAFTARLNSQPLSLVSSVDSADTRFELGGAAGMLTVGPDSRRAWWLTGQAALWLVSLVLASPTLAPRAGIAAGEVGSSARGEVGSSARDEVGSSARGGVVTSAEVTP